MAVCFDETTSVPWAGTPWASGASACGKATTWWAPPGPGQAVRSCPLRKRGYGKRTPVEEYRITNRGGLGIKNYMVTEKTGGVVGIKVVDGSEDLLLATQGGILIRTPVESIRSAGRATQGVIVMRFKEEGDQVISMALTDHEEQAPEAPADES